MNERLVTNLAEFTVLQPTASALVTATRQTDRAVWILLRRAQPIKMIFWITYSIYRADTAIPSITHSLYEVECDIELLRISDYVWLMPVEVFRSSSFIGRVDVAYSVFFKMQSLSFLLLFQTSPGISNCVRESSENSLSMAASSSNSSRNACRKHCLNSLNFRSPLNCTRPFSAWRFDLWENRCTPC